jgi:hypothetical protein
VDMTMPFQFQHLDGEGYVDGRVVVDSVFDLVWLRQRFLTLADEDEDIVLVLLNDFESNENIPENIAGGRLDYPGFCTLGVNEKFQFFIMCHLVTSFWTSAAGNLHSPARSAIFAVCMGNGIKQRDYR